MPRFAAGHRYANSGGRIYSTHYSYVWLDKVSPWSSTANWHVDQSTTGAAGARPDPSVTAILTLASQGPAFSKWLDLVGATPTSGQITLSPGRWDVDGVNAPTQSWIDTRSPRQVSTKHLTFNTPVPPDAGTPPTQCGRVLFSDFT